MVRWRDGGSSARAVSRFDLRLHSVAGLWRCFGQWSEAELFTHVAAYCGAQGGGPLGEAELILTDDNDDRHRFHFETFFNQYDALTLGRYVRPEIRIKAVSG